MTAARSIGILAAAVLAAGAAAAAEPLAEARRGTFTLSLENDMFVSNNDGHFTHGTRLSWLSPEDSVPGWLALGARTLPFFDAGGTLRAGFAVGQNMYTPSDIRPFAPQPDDRPYAGWLYGNAGLVSDTGDRLDRVELSLGVIGPHSYAEDTQTLVHEIIGSPRPNGWDNQLRNEPAVLLTYERQYRLAFGREQNLNGLEFDTTPSIGGGVGNVLDYVTAGAVVRLGQGLTSDYGPPLIRPSLPGSGFFEAGQGFAWYLFAGVSGRLVAHDIFLDGSLFRDGPSVDSRPFVADSQVGLVLTFDRVRVAFTHIFRTREFETQDEADRFGSVSVSFRF